MARAMMPTMVTQADRLEALGQLDVPALIIVGEQDAPFVTDSEEMAKAIPGATLAVIPEAGHEPQFENPEAWWAALRTFLASLT